MQGQGCWRRAGDDPACLPACHGRLCPQAGPRWRQRVRTHAACASCTLAPLQRPVLSLGTCRPGGTKSGSCRLMNPADERKVRCSPQCLGVCTVQGG